MDGARWLETPQLRQEAPSAYACEGTGPRRAMEDVRLQSARGSRAVRSWSRGGGVLPGRTNAAANLFVWSAPRNLKHRRSREGSLVGAERGVGAELAYLHRSCPARWTAQYATDPDGRAGVVATDRQVVRLVG